MDEKIFKEKEYYREKIIEITKEIKDEKFLKFLYQMLQSFKEKWGI